MERAIGIAVGIAVGFAADLIRLFPLFKLPSAQLTTPTCSASNGGFA